MTMVPIVPVKVHRLRRAELCMALVKATWMRMCNLRDVQPWCLILWRYCGQVIVLCHPKSWVVSSCSAFGCKFIGSLGTACISCHLSGLRCLVLKQKQHCFSVAVSSIFEQ